MAALWVPGTFAHDDRYVDSNTIRQVQQTLKDRGFAAAVDGRMGPRTQAAVRQFQRSEHLVPTGQLNRQTLVALGVQRAEPAARPDEPRYSAETMRSVQQTLNHRGFRAGAADGTDNPRTQMALREFQRSENLQDTGRLNQQTLDALGVVPEMAGVEEQPPIPAQASTREVQRRLNSLGYNAGPPDGVMGRSTRAALVEFQRSHNLQPTGQLNRETLMALRVGEPIASR
jgi:peptidoglycan hydrolase-like protein with peptidoglycan-binding domain